MICREGKCMQVAEPGRVRCAKHLAYLTSATIKHRRKRAAMGQCLTFGCSDRPEQGHAYCVECSAHRRKKYAASKAVAA